MNNEEKMFLVCSKRIVKELEEKKRVWFLYGKTEKEPFTILLVRKDEISLFLNKGTISRQLFEKEARELCKKENCRNKKKVEFLFKVLDGIIQ